MASREELMAKIKQLNQLRDREIANRLGSAPGTLKAAREGTAADAHAFQQQFRPGSSGGIDPMDLAKQKEKLLAQLADLQKGQMAGKAGVAKEVAGRGSGDVLKTVLGFLEGVHGKDTAAAAQVATSVNAAQAKMAEARIDAMQGAIDSTGGGGEDAAATMRRLGEAGASGLPENAMKGEPLKDAATWGAIQDQLDNAAASGIDNPAAQRGVLLGIDQYLRNNGLPDGLEDAMLEKNLPGEFLQTALDAQRRARDLRLNGQAVAQMVQEQSEDIAKEAMGDTVKGVRGLMGDKAAGLVELALSLHADLDVDPDDMTSLMDEISVQNKPDDPDAVRRIHDALAELDELGDQPNIPASAREAREDLFADQGFRDFMEQNGLSDPRMALKALRENFRTKLASGKRDDRKRLQEMRASGGDLSFDDDARAEAQSESAALPTQPGSPIPDGASAPPMEGAGEDEVAGKRVSPSGGKSGILDKLGRSAGRMSDSFSGAAPEEQVASSSTPSADVGAFGGRKIRKRLGELSKSKRKTA